MKRIFKHFTVFDYITVVVLLFLFCTSIFADEFRIPLSIYPLEIQAVFAKHGRKLDLDSIYRTRDSWGFIKNEGTSCIIYTYKAATPEDMELIIKIIQGGTFDE